MIGKVTTRIMSPEELAEYIKKNPIKPHPKRRRNEAFENIGVDYKWRSQKGADSRWGN